MRRRILPVGLALASVAATGARAVRLEAPELPDRTPTERRRLALLERQLAAHLPPIVAQRARSMVELRPADTDAPAASASGVVVREDGLLITAGSFVHRQLLRQAAEHAQRGTVPSGPLFIATFADGCAYEARVELLDLGRDLAVLRLDGAPTPRWRVALARFFGLDELRPAVSLSSAQDSPASSPGNSDPLTALARLEEAVGVDPSADPATRLRAVLRAARAGAAPELATKPDQARSDRVASPGSSIAAGSRRAASPLNDWLLRLYARWRSWRGASSTDPTVPGERRFPAVPLRPAHPALSSASSASGSWLSLTAPLMEMRAGPASADLARSEDSGVVVHAGFAFLDADIHSSGALPSPKASLVAQTAHVAVASRESQPALDVDSPSDLGPLAEPVRAGALAVETNLLPTLRRHAAVLDADRRLALGASSASSSSSEASSSEFRPSEDFGPWTADWGGRGLNGGFPLIGWVESTPLPAIHTPSSSPSSSSSSSSSPSTSPSTPPAWPVATLGFLQRAPESFAALRAALLPLTAPVDARVIGGTVWLGPPASRRSAASASAARRSSTTPATSPSSSSSPSPSSSTVERSLGPWFGWERLQRSDDSLDVSTPLWVLRGALVTGALGTAVLDTRGQLVGVEVRGSRRSRHVVDVESVREALCVVDGGGKTQALHRRGLGLTALTWVEPEDADDFRSEGSTKGEQTAAAPAATTATAANTAVLPRGVWVLEVRAESPAFRAGLRAGDVVTAVDGTPVEAVRDVRLAEERVGSASGTAVLTVQRPDWDRGGWTTQTMPVRVADV